MFRVDGSKDSAWKKKREKEAEQNFARALKEDEEEEDVAESGRIFIRNLPYTCSEEDIKNLFTRHGELTRGFKYNEMSIQYRRRRVRKSMR